jgi:hypothetical protein
MELDHPGHPAMCMKDSSWPVSIWGDEATALGELTMIITWMCELSIFKTISLASRYLFALMPKRLYFMDGSDTWQRLLCEVTPAVDVM